MAGDWIKVETATAAKAEVLRMAEMLGIERRECMGLLFDYWAWLDENARTESVPNLSRSSLDKHLNCAGLAACLEVVGWASWSADGWTMTVGNYSRHNGASAKTRAYEQRKKKLQRESVPVLSPTCPVDKGTRVREEKNITTERERISEPTEEHRLLAAKLNLDCEVEWLKYRDQQANAPRKHSDLQAGFRNWLRRAKEFQSQGRAGPAKQEARAKVAAQIFGATNERVGERVIDGEAERVA